MSSRSSPRTTRSFGPVAALATLALTIAVSVLAGASPPRKVIPSSSEASPRSGQADRACTARVRSAFPVFPARDPVVASLEVKSFKDGAPLLPADAVDQLLSVAGERPLLLIEVRGLPLAFARLPSSSSELLQRKTYEEGFSKRLAQLIRDVRAKRPGTAIGVIGLPLERGEHFEDTNRSYDETLQLLTVMNPLGGLVTSGMDTGSLARSQFRASFKAAEGRPVVFRGGNGWQVAVPTSGNSSPSHAAIAPPSATPSEGGSGGGQNPVQQPVLGQLSVPQVLSDWATSSSASDANGDGNVDGFDLAYALAENPTWEPPPETNEPGGGQSSEPPALIVGSGFGGPTATPPASGQPGDPGYGATPAARWTQVPMTTFKEPLNVGVAAFHRNGIDRVEFSANGGPWVPVTAMATNVQTGVCEYFCRLDPQSVADGSIEIRAIAYPKDAGTPRLLAGPFRSSSDAFPAPNGVYSFWCWANAGGTYDRTPIYVSASGSDTTGNGTEDSPYLTLAKASGVLNTLYSGNQSHCELIINAAGTYAYTLSNGVGGGSLPNATPDGWLTVRAADGLDRDDVILTAGGPKQKLLRVKGITARCTNGFFYNGSGTFDGNLLWFDDCAIEQPGGRYADANDGGYTIGNNVARMYATGSAWHDTHGGPSQVIHANNISVTKICADAIRINGSHGCLFNVVISDVNAGSTGAHPDLVSSYDPSASADNIIVYGLKATNYYAQWCHLSFASLSNSAFVNYLTTDASGSTGASQMDAPASHLMFYHLMMYEQGYVFRNTVDTNSAFVGNVFQSVGYTASASAANIAAAYWAHNHFVTGSTYGTDVTTGGWSTIVENAAFENGDFTPIEGSPLLERVPWGLNWTDVYGNPRPSPAATGAVEGQQ